MVVGVLLTCVVSAPAATRYVNDSTGNDAANSPYTNAASPAKTIQAAIDVSEPNDLILVSAGTMIWARGSSMDR